MSIKAEDECTLEHSNSYCRCALFREKLSDVSKKTVYNYAHHNIICNSKEVGN